MKHKIILKIHPWRVRNGMLKHPPKPIKGSKYFNYLCSKGAFK